MLDKIITESGEYFAEFKSTDNFKKVAVIVPEILQNGDRFTRVTANGKTYNYDVSGLGKEFEKPGYHDFERDIDVYPGVQQYAYVKRIKQ